MNRNETLKALVLAHYELDEEDFHAAVDALADMEGEAGDEALACDLRAEAARRRAWPGVPPPTRGWVPMSVSS